MKLTEQERMQEKFNVSKVSKDYFEVTFNGKAKNGILFQIVLEKSDLRHLIQKLDNAI